MDKPVLIDSNVYVTLLRKGIDPVHHLARLGDTVNLATCGVIRLEVLRGVKEPGAHRRLGEFFDVLRNVPTDDRLWLQATKLAFEMDRSGFPIPATDLVIATCALRIRASLLSDDHHFDRVPNLEVTRPEW